MPEHNSTTEDNKKSAVDFLHMVTSGNIDEAYALYVNMAGKHHNLFFPAGLAVLRDAMKENQERMPNKKFTVKHVVGDTDMVVVHSHLQFQEDQSGLITFHMFRFRDGKIVEFWDCSQEIPADMPNSGGPF